MTRRTFAGLALGSVALPAFAKIDSTIHGVHIGVSGYSFQAMSLDQSIAAMREIGLGACEVWFRHIEPKLPREQLREWRLATPLQKFQEIGRKYEDAGVEIVAFTFDMKDDFTDPELDRVFQMTRALGVKRIASSTTLTVAARLVPLMEKYEVEVAFHNHTDTADQNQVAGPESFRTLLKLSPRARINLDIGQFVAAGLDPVPFIVENHAKIPVIHVRDGSRDKGTKLVWGTGQTPIREVLQLIAKERYSIAADIEYDYGGAADPLDEIRRCFAFCRNALE